MFQQKAGWEVVIGEMECSAHLHGPRYVAGRPEIAAAAFDIPSLGWHVFSTKWRSTTPAHALISLT